MNSNKIIIRLLAVFAVAAVIVSASATVSHAEGETIRVISSSVASEFPDGMLFTLEAESDSEITSVAVRFRTGLQARGAYDYLDHEQGNLVDSQLFWRTDTSARYIPPGTAITFSYEIEYASGARFSTEEEEFIYQDARFDWDEVSEGPVTVLYHGPVKVRAQTVLDAIIQTLDNMGPILGADTTEPIRVTMYNNVKEMLGALPPGSATIRRELITEGQAFVNVGTLLVLGGGRLAEGTASHEVTHILTHRAGDSVFRNVPQWLDEGLSEYGNIAPGFSYDIALDFAIATNRLLPITSMRALPGEPEDVIIFYGQARSIVRFMINGFGPDKMSKLMAAMGSGTNVDKAIEEVYGLDRIALENLWRFNIGAPAYEPPDINRVRPTAVPRPELLPYSLTPQPLGEAVTNVVAEPTPEPVLIDTSVLELNPTPETQLALPASAFPDTQPTTVVDSQPIALAEPTAQPVPETASEKEGEQPVSGGACSAPVHGAPRALEVSSFALMFGVIGLALRRRIRR